MSDVVLSICLYVYEQSDILEKNLRNIVKCKSDLIEVIVSDDSADGSRNQKIAESFHDPRIHYYHVDTDNMDVNICNALSHCKGKFAYLFRTKDYILWDKIDVVLDYIEKYPDAAYMIFSAVDENGAPRLRYKERIYATEEEKIYADFNTLIHPSGQLYNLEKLDLNKYEKYVQKYNKTNCYSIHVFIRKDLALKGDFIISDKVTWIYSETLRAPSASVLTDSSRLSFYHPSYVLERYKYGVDFICQEFTGGGGIRYEFLKNYVTSCFSYVTVDFSFINDDYAYQAHYQCDKAEFSMFDAADQFEQFSLEMFNEFGLEDGLKDDLMDLIRGLKKQLVQNAQNAAENGMYKFFRHHNMDSDIFNIWLSVRQSGRTLATWFKEHNYKRVIIACYSNAAVRLYDELKDDKAITELYMIDDREVYIDAITYMYDDEFPEADVVVVTVPQNFNQIAKLLRTKRKEQIVCISDIVYSMNAIRYIDC